jgi:hypothetical protein
VTLEVCDRALMGRVEATDRRRRVAHGVVVALSVAAVVLRVWPPERYGFYPPCPIRALSGVLCPGCGATRALAALVRGDLHAAMTQNLLVVLLVPFAMVWVARWYWGAVRGEGVAAVRLPGWVVPCMTAAAVTFSVLRNFRWSGL